jgi:hypothetical protein
MPKAKLSQIAATWVDEEDNLKKDNPIQEKKPKKVDKKPPEPAKKKQTFSLKMTTIKRLWAHRVRTNKTISEIIDNLVNDHIPE